MKITLKHGPKCGTLRALRGRIRSMNQFNKIPRVLAAVLALMILLSSFQATVPAQADFDPVVVLYDASHSPQFAADDEALGLKLMFDMVNTSTRYILHIHEGELDDEALKDVDILIVAGSDESNPYSAVEYAGISEMLANGSSLFLLGDSTISDDSTYWFEGPMQDMGDNIALNTFLDDLNMTGPRFSINETGTDTWSDTLFDYDHSINESIPWVVQLDATTWDTTHPIFRNINELMTMTSTLKPVTLSSGIGRSYDTSFAQYKRDSNSWANYSMPNMTLFSENPLAYSAVNTTMPSWLSAFEYGLSRVTIVGSTIMFTGRPIDMLETDLNWFYVADNANLFMNILDWLSADFVTAPSAIGSMLIISGAILIIGVAFYLLKKLR